MELGSIFFGAVAGLLFGLWWAARRTRGVELALEEERRAHGETQSALLRTEARFEQLERSQRDDAEKRKQLEAEFKAIAADTLKASNEQFLLLAEQRFEKSETQQRNELDQRKKAIEHLVKPLDEKLKKLDSTTREIEKVREGAYEGLRTQLQALQAQTSELSKSSSALSNALRGSSQARGQWGELALRNIVEFAGMVEHCDFTEQTQDAQGNRPDMVVRIPGGMRIPVDAKVPFTHYERSLRAETPEERAQALVAHVTAVGNKVKELARKDYAAHIEGEIDFTVMFVPAEPILTAAFEEKPDLYADALKNKVIIATPGSLIALLRTVGVYWQQEQTAKNARDILDASRELYGRVRTFSEHLVKVEKGLSGAVKGFNDAAASLSRRVVPQGRRLEELKVVSIDEKKIPELGGVQTGITPVERLGGAPAPDAISPPETESSFDPAGAEETD